MAPPSMGPLLDQSERARDEHQQESGGPPVGLHLARNLVSPFAGATIPTATTTTNSDASLPFHCLPSNSATAT